MEEEEFKLPQLPKPDVDSNVTIFQPLMVDEEYPLLQHGKRRLPSFSETGEMTIVTVDSDDEEVLSVHFMGNNDAYELRICSGHSKVIFCGLNALIQIMCDRQFIDRTVRVWSVTDGTVMFPGQPAMIFQGEDMEELLTIIVPLVNRLCQVASLAHTLNNLDEDSIETATQLLKEALEQDEDLLEEEQLALQLGGLSLKKNTGEEQVKNNSPLHHYVPVEPFVYLIHVPARRLLLRMTDGDLCSRDKLVDAKEYEESAMEDPHVVLTNLVVCPVTNVLAKKSELSSLRDYVNCQFTVEELLMKDSYDSGVDQNTLKKDEKRAEKFCPIEYIDSSMITTNLAHVESPRRMEKVEECTEEEEEDL
jgi:hypothetical protein